MSVAFREVLPSKKSLLEVNWLYNNLQRYQDCLYNMHLLEKNVIVLMRALLVKASSTTNSQSAIYRLSASRFTEIMYEEKPQVAINNSVVTYI